MTTGDVLRTDEMRPVLVVAITHDSQGSKVLLERLDRRPREHRTYHRFKAEVDHFPAWPKGVPYA